jgi:hypothetical protein
MDWLKDIEGILSSGYAWLTGQGYVSSFNAGETVTFKTADNQEITGVVNDDGSITETRVIDGQEYTHTYQGVYYDDESKLRTSENRWEPPPAEIKKEKTPWDSSWGT